MMKYIITDHPQLFLPLDLHGVLYYPYTAILETDVCTVLHVLKNYCACKLADPKYDPIQGGDTLIEQSVK